jgi:hypothetical protein
MARTWRNPDPLVSTGNRIATRIAHRRVEGRRDLKKENLDGQKDLRGGGSVEKGRLERKLPGSEQGRPEDRFSGVEDLLAN